MAWTTPFTAVAGVTLTASLWNLGLRDNMAETEPGKATTAGRTMTTAAVNGIAERVPSWAQVATAQTIAVTTPGDLTTVGPAVTVTTGPSAIYMISAFISNSTALAGGLMSVAVSGATTLSASTTRILRIMSGAASENAKQSFIGMFDGSLTPGSNTFTAKYAIVGSGTASFSSRELVVFPL